MSGDGSDGLVLGGLNSLTFDIGLLASLREKYRFGAFVKNVNSGGLGKGITRQILPRRINIGITYKPTSKLITSIITERLLGKDDLKVKGAIRYHLKPFLEIYTGAQSNPNRIGYGFKLRIGNLHDITGKYLSVAYGFLSHPVLPITQQISIGFRL